MHYTLAIFTKEEPDDNMIENIMGNFDSKWSNYSFFNFLNLNGEEVTFSKACNVARYVELSKERKESTKEDYEESDKLKEKFTTFEDYLKNISSLKNYIYAYISIDNIWIEDPNSFLSYLDSYPNVYMVLLDCHE